MHLKQVRLKVTVVLAVALVAANSSGATQEEVGKFLAACSGDYYTIAATHIQNGSEEGAKTYLDMGKKFQNASSKLIGAEQADAIGAKQLKSNAQMIRNNQPGINNQIFNRAFDYCLQLAEKNKVFPQRSDASSDNGIKIRNATKSEIDQVAKEQAEQRKVAAAQAKADREAQERRKQLEATGWFVTVLGTEVPNTPENIKLLDDQILRRDAVRVVTVGNKAMFATGPYATEAEAIKAQQTTPGVKRFQLGKAMISAPLDSNDQSLDLKIEQSRKLGAKVDAAIKAASELQK